MQPRSPRCKGAQAWRGGGAGAPGPGGSPPCCGRGAGKDPAGSAVPRARGPRLRDGGRGSPVRGVKRPPVRAAVAMERLLFTPLLVRQALHECWARRQRGSVRLLARSRGRQGGAGGTGCCCARARRISCCTAGWDRGRILPFAGGRFTVRRASSFCTPLSSPLLSPPRPPPRHEERPRQRLVPGHRRRGAEPHRAPAASLAAPQQRVPGQARGPLRLGQHRQQAPAQPPGECGRGGYGARPLPSRRWRRLWGVPSSPPGALRLWEGLWVSCRRGRSRCLLLALEVQPGSVSARGQVVGVHLWGGRWLAPSSGAPFCAPDKQRRVSRLSVSFCHPSPWQAGWGGRYLVSPGPTQRCAESPRPHRPRGELRVLGLLQNRALGPRSGSAVIVSPLSGCSFPARLSSGVAFPPQEEAGLGSARAINNLRRSNSTTQVNPQVNSAAR